MYSLKKRILTISAITFVLVACFTAGYFTVTGYLRLKNKDVAADDADGKNSVSANASLEDLINSDTCISIIHRYLSDGKTVYTENSENKADKSIIGMNKSQLKQYYSNKGYMLIEYSSNNVSLLKEVKGWPVGKYVVRGSNNKVAIYSVNDKNELVMVEETDIAMDLVPDNDKGTINLGRVYETLDEAKEYVDYFLGS